MLCHQMGLLRLEFGNLPGLLGEKLFEKLANDPAPIQNPVLVLELRFKSSALQNSCQSSSTYCEKLGEIYTKSSRMYIVF